MVEMVDQLFTEILIGWAVFMVLYVIIALIICWSCRSDNSKAQASEKYKVDEQGRRYYITEGGWAMYIDENGREYSKGLYGERLYEYTYEDQQRELEEELRRRAWEKEEERRALNYTSSHING